MKHIFIFVGIAVLIIMTSCNFPWQDDDSPIIPLVISGLGVTITDYDSSTGKAGDFIFVPEEQKVFLEFGAQVSSPDGFKELPTFEYRIDPNANVMAITDGKVTRMVYQPDTQDYEIGAISTQNSNYYIGYDHITAPTVGLGDHLVAGQILGKPGTWSASLGRFEIMINNSKNGLSYCPFVYFDTSLKDEYEQKISRLMADWELFKGNQSIYDEENHIYPGCRYEDMVSY